MTEKKVGLLGPILAIFVYAIVFQLFLSKLLPSAGWIGLLFSPQAFFAVASLLIIWAKKLSLKDVGLARQRFAAYSILGISLGMIPPLFTVATAALLTVLNHVSEFLHLTPFGGAPLYFDITAKGLVVLLILAPISEELFFRGIFLKSLLERHSTWTAISFSALIFMASHGKLAPGPLMLGFVAGWLTATTRSIIPGIFFHSLANAYGPVMVTYFPNLYRYLGFLYV